MADLYKLAQIRLNDAGLFDISGGGLCTFCDPENFYSYRRDKETGRLSSLIWLK
jgi:copper oxidase (laccase) domain-containing protein